MNEEMDSKYHLILLTLIDVLKEQAEEYAGTYEGLNPWQALNNIKTQAEIWDVPLSELELEGYDIDALLQERPNGRQVGHGED